MTRIARTDRGLVVGEGSGFVPADALGVRDERELLSLAARGSIPPIREATAKPIPADNLTFVRPIDDLGKLWGIGLNYRDHAADLDEDRPGEPASFMKPRSAVVGPRGPIVLPDAEQSSHVTAEAELAVVIGRTCSDVAPDAVDDVVAGYLPVIDMTAEDILRRNPRYLTRAKSFDTFLVFGPWLRTTGAIDDLASITVETVVNGETVESNTVEHMMMGPRELVSFHSRVMTLEPGDVISTGTPGAGRIRPGDRARAEVESVGSVACDVVR